MSLHAYGGVCKRLLWQDAVNMDCRTGPAFARNAALYLLVSGRSTAIQSTTASRYTFCHNGTNLPRVVVWCSCTEVPYKDMCFHIYDGLVAAPGGFLGGAPSQFYPYAKDLGQIQCILCCF